jgi:hypothetical protein
VHRIRLRFHRIDTWPQLAWLARCRPGAEAVDVMHGSRVEIAPEWFCEAAWDGSYEDGGFDRTDLVFGSGGRVRGGALTFVSSGTTVDRLQVLESNGNVWVSNSLPCLLAASASLLDPVYRHYSRDFESICRGLLRYIPLLATSAGTARLIYFDNVTWDGRGLAKTAKVGPARDFTTFEAYRGFLESSLQHIAVNLAAPARRHPFRLLGTISSGYDSPTVAVLARSAGLGDVISFDRCNEEESDSGQEIAGQLGLQVRVIPRDGWRVSELAEVPFLAADAKGEDVYFKSAESVLAGTALLTGFHGDKIWGKYTRALGPDIRRGDQSGLSLTEYRLPASCIAPCRSWASGRSGMSIASVAPPPYRGGTSAASTPVQSVAGSSRKRVYRGSSLACGRKRPRCCSHRRPFSHRQHWRSSHSGSNHRVYLGAWGDGRSGRVWHTFRGLPPVSWDPSRASAPSSPGLDATSRSGRSVTPCFAGCFRGPLNAPGARTRRRKAPDLHAY